MKNWPLRRWLLIAGCVSLAAVAVLFACVSGLQNSRASRAHLRETGIRVTAKITAIHQFGGEPCGIVDVEFRDAGGEPIRVRNLEVTPLGQPLPPRLWKVDLIYDPTHPTSVAEADVTCGDPNGEWRYWLGVAGSVALLLAVVAALSWVTWSRRRSHASEPNS